MPYPLSGPSWRRVSKSVSDRGTVATQRRTMRDGMTNRQQGMMGHMMERMQAGKDSMAMCPMMKQMSRMKY